MWSNKRSQHVSRPLTWDILRHYADISDETTESLENTIDSPSNGILLDTGMYSLFNEFAWYFEATVCLLSSMYPALKLTPMSSLGRTQRIRSEMAHTTFVDIRASWPPKGQI